jgi:hypothetical protein
MAGSSLTHNGSDLEQALERHIAQRTWGRIQRLGVELAEDRVIVHGCTATYYAKQLALVAVREVLDAMPVQLDIQVGPRGRAIGFEVNGRRSAVSNQ